MKLKIFNLFVASLVATILGQIYIMVNRGPVNPLFLFFRIFLHIAPMMYISHENNPKHMAGLLIAYTLSLLAQGTNPAKVYKEIILHEPTDMTIEEYARRRFTTSPNSI